MIIKSVEKNASNLWFYLLVIPLCMLTKLVESVETLKKTDVFYFNNLFRIVLIAFFPIFFFSFRPFPLVRGGHSVSSFSRSFCLQCPSPSHQLPSYLLLPHLKIFSLVSLFSSFLVTSFPSFFFLHTLGLSS